METQHQITGGVTQGPSPKAVVAGLLPLAAALGLLLVDKLVVGDSVPDEVWLTLLGASPVVAGGAATASTGTIKSK